MSRDNYEAVIGLEVHAQLSTVTKMFCRCVNDPFQSEPNANICPVCVGLPGALPVANEQAVAFTIMVGLATGCEIAHSSKWDRKNYFYPDLPKGYQISQYDQPLCSSGQLELGDGSNVRLTRIHLEEDTGTLQHPAGANYSLVNYNRSGVPLLELVTEPDIRSGNEARLCAQEYQRILRALGVARADMEKGELRVEANVSVRTKAQAELGEYGTKVEVKNLNSFRFTQKAIEYEIERQIDLLEKGEKIIQETRGWHDAKQITFSQRVKEGSADYRYFPEPDLPPLLISAQQIALLKTSLPQLPKQQRGSFTDLGLADTDAQTLVNNQPLVAYFQQVKDFCDNLANPVLPNSTNAVVLPVLPQTVANWVINEVADMVIAPIELAKLLLILEVGDISTKIAKDVLVTMRDTGKSAAAIIDEKGLRQVSDLSILQQLIEEVVAAYPAELAAYKGGKEQLFGFFVGQVMNKAKGQANPAVLNELLKKRLLG